MKDLGICAPLEPNVKMWLLGISAQVDVLKGHDFSRAANAAKPAWALQAAEKLIPEGGGGFNPRIKPIESTLALATEGHFPPISP